MFSEIVSRSIAILCIVASAISYIQIYRAICRQQAQVEAQLQAVAFNPVNNYVQVEMEIQNEKVQDSTGEALQGKNEQTKRGSGPSIRPETEAQFWEKQLETNDQLVAQPSDLLLAHV